MKLKIRVTLFTILYCILCCSSSGLKKRIKTNKCKYTFVVNEVDTSSCPNAIQQLQADVYQPQTSVPASPYLPLQAPENIRGNPSEVKEWLTNMEKQLYEELQKSSTLNNTLTRHETSISTTEKKLQEYEKNLTMIFRMLRYLEGSLNEQGEASRQMDRKLSGVMLDVVEVNSVLSKKITVVDGNIRGKHIEVQSASSVTGCSVSPESVVFRDCADVQQRHKESGVYFITPTYSPCPIPVWCDMDTTNGGWLVIVKRQSGKVDFNRLWNEYKKGFGDLVDEFYIGNDNIFLLTNQRHYEVRIDLWDFNGNRVYALYKTFYIEGERDKYRLHIHGFEGSARDAMKTHDRVMFSTADNDNDGYQGYNCAQEWLAGWWYNNCWFAFLTGPYYNISNVRYRGISWNEWKHEQLARVEMKIRPNRSAPPSPDLQVSEKGKAP
ncbi:hypothetical protein DPMN_180167 [Dreissena polymorpha]|uniref:Fibrinogen C-terminal domain-containing protein n=1 Tax=Dreissena polymorpha TaxID=45954 RepID=A0A9D4EIM7_DREPO|nr:hypothetical protein DPMN_180167 [Dreissena polymorpha]